jgi:hypothetical protein
MVKEAPGSMVKLFTVYVVPLSRMGWLVADGLMVPLMPHTGAEQPPQLLANAQAVLVPPVHTTLEAVPVYVIGADGLIYSEKPDWLFEKFETESK